MLLDQIGADGLAEFPPRVGRFDGHAPPILSPFGLANELFADERVYNSAYGAFVEIERRSESVQGQGAVLRYRLQGVSLRDGDVITADPITIPKLNKAYESAYSFVKLHGVLRQLLLLGPNVHTSPDTILPVDDNYNDKRGAAANLVAIDN